MTDLPISALTYFVVCASGGGRQRATDEQRQEQQAEHQLSLGAQGEDQGVSDGAWWTSSQGSTLSSRPVFLFRAQLSGSRQDLSTTCLLDDKVTHTHGSIAL